MFLTWRQSHTTSELHPLPFGLDLESDFPSFSSSSPPLLHSSSSPSLPPSHLPRPIFSFHSFPFLPPSFPFSPSLPPSHLLSFPLSLLCLPPPLSLLPSHLPTFSLFLFSFFASLLPSHHPSLLLVPLLLSHHPSLLFVPLLLSHLPSLLFVLLLSHHPSLLFVLLLSHHPSLLLVPLLLSRALYYVGMNIFKKFDLCEVLNVEDTVLASWLKVSTFYLVSM